MNKETLRAAWIEIDLSKLDRNINNIKNHLAETCASDKPPEIIGVIKADAYGHGAIKCAEVLRKNGVKIFAVATLQEAIDLRDAGVTEDIIMLGLTPDMYVDILVNYDITPVVCDSKNAVAINRAACKAEKNIPIYIAVDSGMGRIGYVAGDKSLAEDNQAAIEDIRKISQLSNINIAGFFSHMATADALDKSFSLRQEELFNEFCDEAVRAGIEFRDRRGVQVPLKRTLANSASIMEIPSVQYDYVRPGIILYGCYPSKEVDRTILSLEQVMSVKANIVQVKEVPKGFSCGYGRKFIAERPSRIATIALGYADGYPRPYSSRAKVIVNGALCPVAGNICMDQFMVDVTDAPDVCEGDEVIIMGRDGINTITAEDIADATGTISYEICCAFGQRLPKVYI